MCLAADSPWYCNNMSLRRTARAERIDVPHPDALSPPPPAKVATSKFWGVSRCNKTHKFKSVCARLAAAGADAPGAQVITVKNRQVSRARLVVCACAWRARV